MSALVTLQFVVPAGYAEGDYAQLHGNGGSGAIDWDTPVTPAVYDIFPNAAGIFGWGLAPWGHSRWGHGHSMRTPGWGHLPWGRHPWGHGTTVIEIAYQVDYCGDYKFALACYDQAGNVHVGDPAEVLLLIHVPPPVPAGLKKNAYNKTTGILTLDAA